MREQDRLCTLPMIVITLLLFVSVAIVSLLNEQFLLQGISAIAAPIAAVAVGLFGMYFFIPRGFFREDRFHAMFVLFSIGLIVFAIAESAGAVIDYLGITDVFLIMVGFALITASIPIVIGVVRYLLGINQTLGYPSAKFVWITAIILPIVIVPIVCLLGQGIPTADKIPISIVSATLAMFVCILLFSLTEISFVFQKGQMIYPIAVLTLGILVLFVRCILWCTMGITPVDTISRYLGIASYLLQGIAISLAVSLESY